MLGTATLSLALAPGAPAAAAGAVADRATRRPAVWVVGDSVTVYAEAPLRRRLERTTSGSVLIDAVGGRNVSLLDDLVDQVLATRSRPRTLVLALGTNPDPGWTDRDYARVVDSVPDSIGVVLVTPFREQGSVDRSIQRQLARYASTMRRLAATRDHVYLASWRGVARHHAGDYTDDGVHPNPRGARIWSALVTDAVARAAS